MDGLLFLGVCLRPHRGFDAQPADVEIKTICQCCVAITDSGAVVFQDASLFLSLEVVFGQSVQQAYHLAVGCLVRGEGLISGAVDSTLLLLDEPSRHHQQLCQFLQQIGFRCLLLFPERVLFKVEGVISDFYLVELILR